MSSQEKCVHVCEHALFSVAVVTVLLRQVCHEYD